MQAAGLVKMGLLLWNSPKAFFGGACGQDWVWQPNTVLIAKSTQLQSLLRGQASDIDKISQLIIALAGDQALQIIRVADGF